ncbi:hypothetical protein [Hymenobacter sp. CRA2]|uniref:hypothetical protein n=1 Tax=Hymenobacter sp. CRA2 TaxID=1955620 RepID=UPI0011179A8F|nr:hypothetical protein [Hymenobacter sp. CRA2]
MNPQNVFSALQYKLGASAPIEQDDIDAISSFTILWNIYEDKFYEKSYNIDDMLDKVEQGKINISDVDYYIKYFYNRYFVEEQGAGKFTKLKLSTKAGKAFINVKLLVERVLTTSSRKEHKIKAILSIIHRLRNNLFHGEKSMSNIHDEIKPVHIANKCLLDIIQSCDFTNP